MGMLSCPEVWTEFFERYYFMELNNIAQQVISGSGTFKLKIDVLKDLVIFYESRLYEELISKPETVIHHAYKGLEKATNIFSVPLSEKNVILQFVNFPKTQRKIVKFVSVHDIDRFISVVGIVKRVSEPQSYVKSVNAVCSACGAIEKLNVVDYTIEKKECPKCRKKKTMKIDHDSVERVTLVKIKIQDLPEYLDANELPRTLDARIFGSIEEVRAGDKVILNGILKTEKTAVEKGKAVERVYLEVNSVEFLEKDIRTINITPEDERKIRELASSPDIYERLAKSLAPSIYGYDDLKLAIILQLFGGTRVETADSPSRGDIHILIVGDPGIAKSRLLRAVYSLAPRAVLSTGYSTTGAGLTVSIVKDEDGKWNLEAGVLVLADKGIALVDEIEKMRKEDREHLLEALEQQTITVSKAGIYATLNSRTSVLATANPKYGKFNKFEPLADQITLEPNILSRFDLIFVLLDEASEERDQLVAEFILEKSGNEKPLLDQDLIRKYILYAREHVKHVTLSREAIELIKKFYVELRLSAKENVTITPRQLEALRRLAQASAKVQLRDVATAEDAERAIRLMRASMSTWAVDPETGAFDLTYGLTGVGARTRDRISTIKAVIDAFDNGEGAKQEDVLKACEEKGIPRGKAMEIINKMREFGEVFFPKAGLIKLVR
ncbi:MAG: minichromosome maintenance protein MCM [Archaeoglobaceae archaeon]